MFLTQESKFAGSFFLTLLQYEGEWIKTGNEIHETQFTAVYIDIIADTAAIVVPDKA